MHYVSIQNRTDVMHYVSTNPKLTMAYRIRDIAKVEANRYPLYFFDANIWLFILKPLAHASVDEKYYRNFFEEIIELQFAPATSRRRKPVRPKIVVTNLLLSEIINAYMRHISMYIFFRMRNEDPHQKSFKRDYRDGIGKENYSKELKRICSDLISYKDYFVIKDDGLCNIDPLYLLQQLPSINSDFNDFYYYELCYDNKIPIVTDDRDFIFQDLDILTRNRRLLQLKKRLKKQHR